MAAVLGAAGRCRRGRRTSAPPARPVARAEGRPTADRAAIVLGDWPAIETARADRRRRPTARCGRLDLVDVAIAAARCAHGDAVRRRAWCAIWPRRWTWCRARPQLRAVTADGDLVGAGLGQRRLGPQAQHAGDHLRGREGPRRAGRRGRADRRAERRAVRRAGRAGQPRQDAAEQALRRAQRVRRRDLVDLRTAGSARPGRPHAPTRNGSG